MPTLDDLLRVLASDPEDPVLHFSLAHAYRSADDLANAVKHYRLATKYKPDYSAAWFELARLAESAGDLDTACEAYRGAMSASGRAGDDHILKAAEVRLRRLENSARRK